MKKKFMGQISEGEWKEVLAVDETNAAIEIVEDYEIYTNDQYQQSYPESYPVKIKNYGGGISEWTVYCESVREYNAILKKEVV